MPWPLSVAFPLTLAGSIALMLAYDTAGAWLTRSGRGAKYASLWPVQFGLYVAIGFVAMFAVLDLRRVELIGAITGFIEATVGWAIAWRIGPGRMAAATPAKVIYAVTIVTVFAFGCSIAGALLFNLVLGAVLRSKGL